MSYNYNDYKFLNPRPITKHECKYNYSDSLAVPTHELIFWLAMKVKTHIKEFSIFYSSFKMGSKRIGQIIASIGTTLALASNILILA